MNIFNIDRAGTPRYVIAETREEALKLINSGKYTTLNLSKLFQQEEPHEEIKRVLGECVTYQRLKPLAS